MRTDVFMSRTESGGVDISVVKHGLSSGPAHKYDTMEKAKEVLLGLGFDAELVDSQLQVLSRTPQSVLVRFPATEIPDDVLASLGFKAAAFTAA
jgi:hypothetical protein